MKILIIAACSLGKCTWHWWQCRATFIEGDVRGCFAAMLCQCLCLSCLSHLLWMTAKTSDNHSVLNVCEKPRERGRELSATLANHLIGCHTELTFEGYRSISPEMKKRDERERGQETEERDWICSERAVESAALINASVYPSAPHGLISSMISTHPGPPPPLAIPHTFSLSISPREKRERKHRDERKKKEYSRGRATGGWVNA